MQDMSVIAELAIFPMDKGTSVSPWVARVVQVIRASGLGHVMGPMGTCMEGPWQDVMNVVDACYRALEPDCDRIYMTLKVDARRGEAGRLDAKLDSVRQKLG